MTEHEKEKSDYFAAGLARAAAKFTHIPFPYLLGVAALVICLSGCATTNVTNMQTECEAKTKTFPEMAACLKDTVAASHCSIEDRLTLRKKCLKTKLDENDIKLYLLKAEQLSLRVQKHEISDLDARVELQKLFVELGNQADLRGAAAAAAGAANRQRTTRCHDNGYGVTCTTD